jgi:protein-disulfide isomerase
MRYKIMTTVAAALAFTACSGQGPGAVKAPDAVGDLSKAQIEAIVKEYLMREPIVLAEAFAELQRREEEQKIAATENAWKKVSLSKDDPTLGPADAPITIVEFTDYNCGYCKLATSWVMNQVDDRRGDAA